MPETKKNNETEGKKLLPRRPRFASKRPVKENAGEPKIAQTLIDSIEKAVAPALILAADAVSPIVPAGGAAPPAPARTKMRTDRAGKTAGNKTGRRKTPRRNSGLKSRRRPKRRPDSRPRKREREEAADRAGAKRPRRSKSFRSAGLEKSERT